MKKLLLTLTCISLITAAAYSQTASFSIVNGSNTTSGTYNPNDTFTLTINGTFSGFTASGYSLWLETQILNSFNTHINITGETYFTFTSPNDDPADYTNPGDVFPKAFTDTGGASTGFRSDVNVNPDSFSNLHTGDLGATGAAKTAGTYHLADITFTLSNAPAGMYTLATTTLNPKQSEIADSSFVSHFAPEADYTITIVPEPATLSLFGLGGLGALGMTILRRRRA